MRFDYINCNKITNSNNDNATWGGHECPYGANLRTDVDAKA